MDNSKVSEAILKDVNRLKIPTSTLAKFLGLSRSSVCKRLKGTRNWKITELRELARIFGHDPNYYEGFLNMPSSVKKCIKNQEE